MVRFRKDPPQEQLDMLFCQIGEWRQTRRGAEPMPVEIWDAAVALAREFGVCRVARALTIDYCSLSESETRAVCARCKCQHGSEGEGPG